MKPLADFDPWQATEDEAFAETIRQGFEPVLALLVLGTSGRLAPYLLPVDAPLRVWCVAQQVRALCATSLALAETSMLQHAQLLCNQHGLQVPWDLTLNLLIHSKALDRSDPAEMARRMKKRQKLLLEELRERPWRRAVWLLMRRYKWAHGPEASKDVLWRAIVNRDQLADDGELDAEVIDAVRRLPMGKTKAQLRLAEAETLFGPPTWKVAHVPPPMI